MQPFDPALALVMILNASAELLFTLAACGTGRFLILGEIANVYTRRFWLPLAVAVVIHRNKR